jgi:hypothetical protein
LISPFTSNERWLDVEQVRPSVTFMISEPCACCHATGRVEALETSFSKIEQEICQLLVSFIVSKVFYFFFYLIYSIKTKHRQSCEDLEYASGDNTTH